MTTRKQFAANSYIVVLPLQSNHHVTNRTGQLNFQNLSLSHEVLMISLGKDAIAREIRIPSFWTPKRDGQKRYVTRFLPSECRGPLSRKVMITFDNFSTALKLLEKVVLSVCLQDN